MINNYSEIIRKEYPDEDYSVGEALCAHAVKTFALSGVTNADEAFLLMACFKAFYTGKTDGELIDGIKDVLMYEKLNLLDEAWEVVDNILNSHETEGDDDDVLTERIF